MTDIGAANLIHGIYSYAAYEYEKAVKDIAKIQKKPVMFWNENIWAKYFRSMKIMNDCREFFNEDPWGQLSKIDGESVCYKLWLKGRTNGSRKKL